MPETPTDVRVVTDQVYSRVGGFDRLADLYLPSTTSSQPPVVIWLHGGGWRFGDRHMAPDLALFAKLSGIAAVSIEYRLSDEAKFPAAVEDVKTAVRWVRSEARRFGLDGGRIGLWGSSAGAHLASCAASSLEDAFCSDENPAYSSAVMAVVDGYGPTDFARIDRDRASHTALGDDAERLGIGNVLPPVTLIPLSRGFWECLSMIRQPRSSLRIRFIMFEADAHLFLFFMARLIP